MRRKPKVKQSYIKLFVYFWLSAWAFTTVYPIIWVVQNSFKDRNRILEDSFALPLNNMFTWTNYEKAVRGLNIFTAYKNSIFIAAMVAILVMLFAGMASFVLARYKFRGRELLYTLAAISMTFPIYATIVPVYAMESAWGITNTGNWWLSMLSIILPQTAGNLAFAIVVLTGFIKELPLELEEAAFMEGCSVYRIYFRVILPLARPSFVTVSIFSFMWSYNDLFTQTFFLRRPETRTITRLLSEITSMEGTDYGLMAAAVTLIVIPVLLVYIFLQKYMIEGMTAGALKG